MDATDRKGVSFTTTVNGLSYYLMQRPDNMILEGTIRGVVEAIAKEFTTVTFTDIPTHTTHVDVTPRAVPTPVREVIEKPKAKATPAKAAVTKAAVVEATPAEAAPAEAVEVAPVEAAAVPVERPPTHAELLSLMCTKHAQFCVTGDFLKNKTKFQFQGAEVTLPAKRIGDMTVYFYTKRCVFLAHAPDADRKKMPLLVVAIIHPIREIEGIGRENAFMMQQMTAKRRALAEKDTNFDFSRFDAHGYLLPTVVALPGLPYISGTADLLHKQEVLASKKAAGMAMDLDDGLHDSSDEEEPAAKKVKLEQEQEAAPAKKEAAKEAVPAKKEAANEPTPAKKEAAKEAAKKVAPAKKEVKTAPSKKKAEEATDSTEESESDEDDLEEVNKPKTTKPRGSVQMRSDAEVTAHMYRYVAKNFDTHYEAKTMYTPENSRKTTSVMIDSAAEESEAEGDEDDTPLKMKANKKTGKKSTK